MVRYGIAYSDLPDSVGVTTTDQHIQCVSKYMSRTSNTLNHIVTLKNVIKPGPVTTLNIHMNIHTDIVGIFINAKSSSVITWAVNTVGIFINAHSLSVIMWAVNTIGKHQYILIKCKCDILLSRQYSQFLHIHIKTGDINPKQSSSSLLKLTLFSVCLKGHSAIYIFIYGGNV